MPHKGVGEDGVLIGSDLRKRQVTNIEVSTQNMRDCVHLIIEHLEVEDLTTIMCTWETIVMNDKLARKRMLN